MAHVGPAILAKNWGIGISSAKQNLDSMAQQPLCTILHLTLSRHFHTNNRQLWYRKIGHAMFTDTLEPLSTIWFQQNKYEQIFTTAFGWARAYPMKMKLMPMKGSHS